MASASVRYTKLCLWEFDILYIPLRQISGKFARDKNIVLCIYPRAIFCTQSSDQNAEACLAGSEACLAGSEAWLAGSKACLAGSWADLMDRNLHGGIMLSDPDPPKNVPWSRHRQWKIWKESSSARRGWQLSMYSRHITERDQTLGEARHFRNHNYKDPGKLKIDHRQLT